jgi:predicted nucleic acid-binding protein
VRILIDTNVVLDVVLARQPWAAEAIELLDRVARGETQGLVAAHSVTTVFYVVERERDRRTALTAVGDLLSIVGVAELGSADFQRALTLGLKDFEDAVQVAASLRVGADFLVTRNARDFRGSPVAIRAPGEILALLAATSRPEIPER